MNPLDGLIKMATRGKVLNGINSFANNHNNGQCSRCGKCCSNQLPVTDQELNILKRYIKRHNIKPSNLSPLTSISPSMGHAMCPFLTSKGCSIYNVKPEIRPIICRKFFCGSDREVLVKQLQDMGLNPFSIHERHMREELF